VPGLRKDQSPVRVPVREGGRRGAEEGRFPAGALGRGNVVPVATVVVNPTAVPSHRRGFARNSFTAVQTSRDGRGSARNGQPSSGWGDRGSEEGRFPAGPQGRREEGTWFPLLPLLSIQPQFLRTVAASRETLSPLWRPRAMAVGPHEMGNRAPDGATEARRRDGFPQGRRGAGKRERGSRRYRRCKSSRSSFAPSRLRARFPGATPADAGEAPGLRTGGTVCGRPRRSRIRRRSPRDDPSRSSGVRLRR